MNELLVHPLFVSTFSGLITAAGVDIVAFRSWKSFDEARAYSWPLAYWRWFQGTLLGFLSGLGIGAINNVLA